MTINLLITMVILVGCSAYLGIAGLCKHFFYKNHGTWDIGDSTMAGLFWPVTLPVQGAYLWAERRQKIREKTRNDALYEQCKGLTEQCAALQKKLDKQQSDKFKIQSQSDYIVCMHEADKWEKNLRVGERAS